MLPLTEQIVALSVQVAAMAAFVGLIWCGYRWLASGKPSTTPSPITSDGKGGSIVPLRAAFMGLRGLPWIGIAHNNANPKLIVTPTGIVCRVLRERSIPFDQIESVEVRSFGATVNLVFQVRGSVFTFVGNVGSLVLARQVLALLPKTVSLGIVATKLRGQAEAD